MAGDGKDQRAEVIPPNPLRRMYDSRTTLVDAAHRVPSGWGLGNLVEGMRHRSAVRLAYARAANVDAWTHFLIELQKLGYAMIDWERMRRRLENLDAILDEEEDHERDLLKINREREIKEAERARDGVTATTEPKDRTARLTPEERIRQGVEKRKQLRTACDGLVKDVLEAARAAGTEHAPEVQREIDNIKADFAKEIAKTYEKA